MQNGPGGFHWAGVLACPCSFAWTRRHAQRSTAAQGTRLTRGINRARAVKAALRTSCRPRHRAEELPTHSIPVNQPPAAAGADVAVDGDPPSLDPPAAGAAAVLVR